MTFFSMFYMIMDRGSSSYPSYCPVKAVRQNKNFFDADLQLMNNAERERQLQKQKKRRRQGREDEVLKRLEKFKAAFSSISNGLKDEDTGGKDGVPDWMGFSLSLLPTLSRILRYENIFERCMMKSCF
ncbi:uncharacterized protein [Coffea arabica]|uniref:Uncharacterized protein LOC113690707 n=1 Tax=Coffea arabica TaxID=13443 RepID=A0A6P6SE96_COFAR|nr:uncharacterized protein LOC113690707 [Coffea arabica]XP_027064504.1 uncharacterized protein LOC113690707 [Coffea arabica]XP_027064505.1 uncharacterized protein LOC113690707 [Coffea arabica]XP_027064506.1 uncharacterized protein LOC113690707 [Coffea arabica]